MYELFKIAHILGACVIFGTGMGIAYFMLMAHRTRNVDTIAITARHVVWADYIFTAVAVVVQPISGAALVFLVGYTYSDLWIWLSLALYVFIGACWLPVVWMQAQMKTMAEEAMATGKALDPKYHRYFRLWFALGWPAFFSVVAIIALMVTRPL